MNGLDSCLTCGHDMEFTYSASGQSRRRFCPWCRMAKYEMQRRSIGMKIDILNPRPTLAAQDEVVFDLARQGMERVIRELESEGAWL